MVIVSPTKDRRRDAPPDGLTTPDLPESAEAEPLDPAGVRWLWLLALALGLATGVSRLPFRSRYLFSWDSANFALALDQYNVAFHQPQPPGYPLYVASAWAARTVLGDANASYVALSIVASALAVAFLVMAAGTLYGPGTGVLSGVVLATSSVFWSQSVVAYPYAFLSCFTSLVAWLCTLISAGGPHRGRLVIAAGFLTAVGAGFRTELLPFLAPLVLYAGLRRPGPWRSRVIALAVAALAAGLTVLAWYVPMVQRSGGLAAYQTATGSYYTYFIQTTSGAGKLLLGVLENSRALVGFVYNGLGLAVVPIVYFLGRYFAPQRMVTDARVRLLLLWLLPPLAFYVTVHIGNPGYVLSFLPALSIYAVIAIRGLVVDLRQAVALLQDRLPLMSGSVTRWLAGGRWVWPATTALLLGFGLINTALFLVANGEGRYKEIRQIDQIFARQLPYIQQRFPAGSTVLFAYDRSRQYRYYLPLYRLELLFNVAVAGAVTDTSRYWERRTEYAVPAGVRAVLFPDLSQNTSDQPGLVQKVDLGGGVDLYVAEVQAGDVVRYGYQYATAQRRV